MANYDMTDAYDCLYFHLRVFLKEFKTGEEVKKHVFEPDCEQRIDDLARSIEANISVSEFRSLQQDLLEEDTSLEDIIDNTCLFWVKCKLQDWDWEEWFQRVTREKAEAQGVQG